ncbi:MAG: hypothetical protein ABJE66_25095 [Deltaproteobacteria bacterium]
MWRMVSVVGVACVACGSSSDPAPAAAPVREVAPPQNAAPAPAPAVVRNKVDMSTAWSDVAAVGDCWYFSGPAGRDTRLAGPITLARDGDKVTATIGGATFTGTYRDSELDLARDASHHFDDAWTTHERIHGAFRSGKITAHYHYEECEQGTHCPNHCTIEATLELAAI